MEYLHDADNTRETMEGITYGNRTMEHESSDVSIQNIPVAYVAAMELSLRRKQERKERKKLCYDRKLSSW